MPSESLIGGNGDRGYSTGRFRVMAGNKSGPALPRGRKCSPSDLPIWEESKPTHGITALQ